MAQDEKVCISVAIRGERGSYNDALINLSKKDSVAIRGERGSYNDLQSTGKPVNWRSARFPRGYQGLLCFRRF
jgi:hypothetical protein